jgi:hypothetical protein
MVLYMPDGCEGVRWYCVAGMVNRSEKDYIPLFLLRGYLRGGSKFFIERKVKSFYFFFSFFYF